MSLTVVDNPPDRPEWIQETIRLLTAVAADGRRSLLHLVEEATDADLLAGTPDDWALGQIAVHLLIVERGVSLISLRLARGEEAGNTGQPRPAPGVVTLAASGRWPRRPPPRRNAFGPTSRPSRTSSGRPLIRSTVR